MRPPDHTTISRTRRLIDVETHRAVLIWVQQRLVEVGLLKGRPSRPTLEANAAMRSIVRRDTEETYHEFLKRLAKATGIETPTREDLARLVGAVISSRVETPRRCQASHRTAATQIT
jgi:transposase